MNTADSLTRQCNPLGFYTPREQPVPAGLIWVAVVHCYCLIIFGTLANALALWCVATCSKTRRPMKVLLVSVFLPVLVICLAMQPVVGEVLAAHLTCDPDRISKTVIAIATIVYVSMVQMERVFIAAIAVVRAAAVWAPQRPTLGIRGAVVLVVVTCIYAILTSLGYMKAMAIGQDKTVTSVTIIFFITITLPALITVAAYILMIFAIQRNKRRLVVSQQQQPQQQQARATTSMDQATRAILAVFISNFVFSLPHSIYHLTGKQPLYLYLIFHVIYYTHFVVDPMVYLWFNRGCRQKVISSIRKVTQYVSFSSTTQSVQQTEVTASCDHQKQQNSSTHMQEDTKQ